MAFLTRTNWTTGEQPSAAEFNNIGLDIRTFGGNVDAAGYHLLNVGKIGIGVAPGADGFGVSGSMAVHSLAAKNVSAFAIVTLKSNEGSGYLYGTINLISDATAANRRLAIVAAEESVGYRTITLNESGGGNVGIGTASQFGSGSGVIGIGNASADPSANPTGGGVLFVSGGALKYRGSSGTVTTLGAA